MEKKKLSTIDLYGVKNLLRQLLEKNILSVDECNAILRHILLDNGYSEFDILLFESFSYRKNVAAPKASNEDHANPKAVARKAKV